MDLNTYDNYCTYLNSEIKRKISLNNQNNYIILPRTPNLSLEERITYIFKFISNQINK